LIKTIKWNTGSAAERFRFNHDRKLDLLIARHWKLKKKKIKQKNKSSSSQAGGPSHKESGSKLKVLTAEEYKILWDKYE